MKKILMLILCCILVLTGCGPKNQVVYEIADGSEDPDSSASFIAEASEKSQADGQRVSENSASEEELREITVYICGEVNAPGVYTLPEGSRVYDAVRAAGGLTENADEKRVNQALKLKDEDQIILYAVSEETVSYEETGVSGAFNDGKVHLNTATKEELMTLPGIGEARADEIINYRTEHGYFTSIEEIMNISGIKDRMFEKIRDYIEI